MSARELHNQKHRATRNVRLRAGHCAQKRAAPSTVFPPPRDSKLRTYGALHSIPATTGLSERRALRRTLEIVFVYSWGKGVTQATPSPMGWDGRPYQAP